MIAPPFKAAYNLFYGFNIFLYFSEDMKMF